MNITIEEVIAEIQTTQAGTVQLEMASQRALIKKQQQKIEELSQQESETKKD